MTAIFIVLFLMLIFVVAAVIEGRYAIRPHASSPRRSERRRGKFGTPVQND